MTTDLIGHISFYDFAVYFFLYSFLGWIIEVIYATLKTGKFVNRGFLNGPVCPIYGAGVSVLVLLFNPIADKWWLLFLAGVIYASLLELITGFVLDKIFKTKWWDYSGEKFNLGGYVCLKFSLLWGLGVVLVFYTLVPLTDKLTELVPFGLVSGIILAATTLALLVDLGATLVQLYRLKRDINEVNAVAKLIHKNSDRLGGAVSGTTLAVKVGVDKLKEKLEKTRLVKAFPSLIKYLTEKKKEK